MPDHILVAVAWPYANSQIHVGNITGSYLPADIFTRYQRLLGNQVIMVSGSDAHGTPVTVRADAENSTPLEVYQKYHAGFLELFQKLGLTYDLYTVRIISRSHRISSWRSRKTITFIPSDNCNGMLLPRDVSCPTAT
jgi:methionyl-tRNA synthetase